MFNVKRQIYHEKRHMTHRVLCEFKFSGIPEFNFDEHNTFSIIYACTGLFKMIHLRFQMIIFLKYKNT